MASASSSKDAPSLVDNFVPLRENFDGDEFGTKASVEERNWELERDLAFQTPTVYELNEKEAVNHMSASQGKRKETKNDSLLNVLCAFVFEHQVGISINLVLLLTLTHGLFPRARPLTHKFFELSYYDTSTGRYTQGWDDMYFVVFWIVMFTGLRAGIMEYILKPIAWAGGIKKDRVRVRFAEQAWLVIYDSGSWGLGMYLMYHTPYFFNLREVWTNYPTQSMTGLFKWYYLVQFAFWLQQMVVVNIEERRKDYAQMFTHHIFTSALIFASYGNYQTKVGNVILCIMDNGDILLSLAKCLKYLHFNTVCDITFGIFLVSWFVCRHVFYLFICWSLYADAPSIMVNGCYEASSGALVSSDTSSYPGGNDIMSNVMKGWTDPGGVVCWTSRLSYAFQALLLALQVIILIWFGMIVRVAWKVITGNGADDSRSDTEADSEEEIVSAPSRSQSPPGVANVSVWSGKRSMSAGSSGSQSTPYEEEVGVDKLYFGKRRTPSPRTKRKKSGTKGRTSALSIPGHSDPKDILNRIGCETKTTDQDER